MKSIILKVPDRFDPEILSSQVVDLGGTSAFLDSRNKILAVVFKDDPSKEKFDEILNMFPFVRVVTLNDRFVPENEDILSDIESRMLVIQRILYKSQNRDGDPLPDDDKSYVINDVLHYHPHKEALKSPGIEYITVNKRCFFIVTTTGQSKDFSHIKCLENYVKEKYPSSADSFNSKYFAKPDSPNEHQSPQAGSQKEETQAHSSWGLQKSSRESAGGWGSDNNAPGERGFKSTDSKNNEQKSQPSWGKSNTSNSTRCSKKPESDSSDQAKEDGTSVGWGSKGSGKANTQSCWGKSNDSVATNQTGKTNEADGPKSWESGKEVNSTRSIWGQSRDTTPKNYKKTGECDSKKTAQSNSSSTRGSKKPESDSSDQAKEDGTSVGWGSKGEDGKLQSTGGQPSETAWKSSPGGDGWGSTETRENRVIDS